MMTVKTTAVAERQVEWVPSGWGRDSIKVCIIRDGEINGMPSLEAYQMNKDIDGAIEFLQAIKMAMAETRK